MKLERREGILDVSWRRRNDDRARLQVGRNASMCCHLEIDVRQADRICSARWSQEILHSEDSACEGLIACSLLTRQDEPNKDRQGNGKQHWPYYVKGNGQKACAINDKLVWRIKQRKMGRSTDRPCEEASGYMWNHVRAKEEVTKNTRNC